jgi:hypothetical protein
MKGKPQLNDLEHFESKKKPQKNSLALLNRLPRTQPSHNNAGRLLSI